MRMCLLGVACLVACLASPALAQPYAIDWSTVDGGGGTSSGGSFVLSGTIGQHDAGPVMTGGTYSVTGGYWAGAAVPPTPPCGDADFDNDGDTGTDSDIEAFFLCLGGSCQPGWDSVDFDQDGDTGTDQDIEAFFRVLGGGVC